MFREAHFFGGPGMLGTGPQMGFIDLFGIRKSILQLVHIDLRHH